MKPDLYLDDFFCTKFYEETFFCRIIFSREDVTGEEATFCNLSSLKDETLKKEWNKESCFFQLLITSFTRVENINDDDIFYKNRVKKNLNLGVSIMCAEKLAKAGLVAISDSSTSFRCISCSIEIRGCSESDDIFQIHADLEPNCCYVVYMKAFSESEPVKFANEQLFFALKRLLDSSRFEVAMELGCDPELVLALAARKKILEDKEYASAGDLVCDADEACYNEAVSRRPGKVDEVDITAESLSLFRTRPARG